MHIGYYAHHHGSGHCRQADKLAKLLDSQGFKAEHLLTVFTSLSADDYQFDHLLAEQIVRLPPENDRADEVLPGRAGEYWQPEAMHYSPVGNLDIQSRSQCLLEQVATRQIDVMIVDLSVEVALLCRAASIPYLYVRLPGERDDTPHLNAFSGALGLIAAYPECLESSNTPDWVRQKTIYLGFLTSSPLSDLADRSLPAAKSDFIHKLVDQMINADDQPLNPSSPLIPDGHNPKASFAKRQLLFVNDLSFNEPIITVIKGFGGHERIDNQLRRLRQALPKALIISLGPISSQAIEFVDIATQVDDVTPFLQHSDVLVMACGLNAVGEVCQVDTPLVVIPDERPHHEQEVMAEALVNCGRAVRLEQFLAKPGLLIDPKLSAASSNRLPGVPDAQLMAQLQEGWALKFINSLAAADDVKAWFYGWLLPKLSLAPKRSSD